MKFVLRLALALLPSLAVACSSGALQQNPEDSGVPSNPDASAGTDAPPTGSTDAGSDTASDVSVNTDAGGFVDPRDSQRYATIQIGQQTWLARNLNFVIATESFCYNDDSKNCDKDGRLYRWKVAPTACPTGFRLGTDDDWKALETAVGMAANQLNLEGYSTVRGTDEGTKLKAPDGFGASHMAGYRTGTTYDALGDRTYFWVSTTRGSDVWRRRVAAAEPTVFRFTNPPSDFAISVRCVMNQ